jgi:cytochrome c oxidase cbb3-type subunit 1
LCSIRQELVWAALGLSWGIFAAVGHGHESHHVFAQIAALAVLLAWVPLLAWHWLAHEWPAAARPWLLAALGWWALLVASGWLAFLPGWSERLKFTHGLVAHAHLAMAGVVTGVNAVLLIVLARRPAPRGVFAAWQLGCVVHVAALLVLGAAESARAAELFRSEAWTQALLGMRLAAGLLMTGASVWWLADQFPG